MVIVVQVMHINNLNLTYFLIMMLKVMLDVVAINHKEMNTITDLEIS